MTPNPSTNPYAWRPPDPAEASRSLLLVEDEAATLRFYQTGLKGLQGWQTLTATDGRAALDILRQRFVDVLVTDLNMPIMDGYRLIAAVHGLYPSLPVIVLTSLPPGDPQDRAKQLGAMRVISKPVRLSQLMEEIKLIRSREAPGQVKGIGLGSLLQLMTWESKTCTMTVRSGERIGHLYVEGGRLVHAISASEEGLMAAYIVLSWENTLIEFVETCRVQPSIDISTEELLMNLAVFRDHQAKATMIRKPMDPWEGRPEK
ncbi:MAG TPA: response regulator [Holophaga sp.]|jgi:CheY-like chemotaxis protein|nr:response regulator [Holophaga sp.]